MVAKFNAKVGGSIFFFLLRFALGGGLGDVVVIARGSNCSRHVVQG